MNEVEFIAQVVAQDRGFRRRAIVHPEKVHIDRDGPMMGEAIYTLYQQNIWPEITGPQVWRVSTTYWTYA